MKPTRKHIFIAIICAAIIISLLIFAWNESQKQPFDLVFYGAEIEADGTEIKQTEFQIKGYLKEKHGSMLSPYTMYHDPITFEGIPEIVISLESYQGSDLDVYYHGDASDPNYLITTFAYNSATNEIDFPQIYLCNQLCCCIIECDDRYFAGSTDADYDISQIFASLPEVELDSLAG